MYRILIVFILMVTVTSMAFAAEEVTPTPPVTYPGVAEVIPTLSGLETKAGVVAGKIASLGDKTGFEAQISDAKNRQEALNQWITEQGDPSGWNFDRLEEVSSQISGQRGNLNKIMSDIVSKMSDLDALRGEWSSQGDYWKGWKTSLQKPDLKVAKEPFTRAEHIISEVLSQIDKSTVDMVALQKNVTTLQTNNFEVGNTIENTLRDLRRQTFKRTAPPFYSRHFFQQFDAELWSSMKNGINLVQGSSQEFWSSQGWILFAQMVLAVVLGVFFRKYHRRGEDNQEWEFILVHPWATGIFVSLASLGFLYSHVPELYRLFLWAMAAISGSILTAKLLKNPRKIFMVYLLATLFILSLALQEISFPAPLYRLYLAILSLGGAPLMFFLARSNIKAHQGRVDGFTLFLRLGALILLVSFLAQTGGFSTLASHLIESSVETVFLILMTAMGIRLGRGGLEYLFDRPLLRRKRFFRRFGSELEGRLKGILKAIILGYAFLYLAQVWGLYASARVAWNELLRLSFTVGEVVVSAKMVFLVVLVLYLSLVVSWGLRALLETEVFPRKSYDRGIKDAIKKLLHYSLMVVGFLTAISVAGIELKNLAVLLGAFGIGIGFGLQNIVNNFVSGLILLFERPVKVGDTLVVDGEWGLVKKIGLRSTIVETYDRAEIIVPNSDLISQKVTNWTLSTNVARVVLPVGVAYGSDISRVLGILMEAAKANEEVLADPEPSPIFSGFGGSSLDFELRVWVGDVSRMLAVRSWLGQYIDKRFREEGVEIPFPQTDLHVRSVDESIFKGLEGKVSKTEKMSL